MDDEKNGEENEATDQATDQEHPNKKRRVHILDDAEKDATAGAVAELLRVVGVGGHICHVGVEATATLQELKACIEASVHIPAVSQRLFHGVNCAETLGSGLGMYERVYE